MSKFNAKNLNLVLEFFPSMDSLLEAGCQSRNIGRTGSARYTVSQRLKQEGFLHLWRSYCRAKRGETRLSASTFEKLVAKCLTGHVPEEAILTLNRLHEAYQSWYATCSSQQNKSWGTGFVAPTNIEPYFRDILSSAVQTKANVFSGPQQFFDFLDASVDGPATSGEIGEAITQAFIICSYLERPSLREEFPSLSEDLYWSDLASAAWWGGWAAHQVGQERKFDWFLNVARRAVSKRKNWMTLVAYHTLMFYLELRSDPFGRAPSGHAARVYEVFFETDAGSFRSASIEIRSEMYLNPAREVILGGGGLDDKPRGINMTVAELLKRSRGARPNGTYSIITAPLSFIVESEAAFNSNRIDSAKVCADLAEELLPDEEMPTLNFLRWNCNLIQGRIEQKLTSRLDNRLLRNALRAAMDARSLPDSLKIYAYLNNGVVGIRSHQ